jgi:NAD(P)-dependent dehydrogenase (short-subunit alcohol dehydrogenase family)
LTCYRSILPIESVRAFAEAFAAKYDHLDALINNGGHFRPSTRGNEAGI